MKISSRPLVLLLAAVTVLVSAGCTSPPPAIEVGPGAEVSHDGLHLVRGSRRMQRIWVKPDIDLSGYTQIIPLDAGIHYRRTPRSSRGEFPLSEDRMELLRAGLQDALQEELERNGGWQIVEERGPNALVMRGALIDLVVTAPPAPSGRNRSYSSSVGEATLVIELFDSQSMEILARLADRRAATRDTASWRNDAITNRAAARRVFRDWARRVAALLDYARTGTLPTTEIPEES